jgi:hypothetical protein
MRPPLPRPSQQLQWYGWLVDDCTGLHLGKLETIYEDEAGTALWPLVRLARFSSRYALIPPASVLATESRLWIPYTRDTVERAPQLYEAPCSIDAPLEARVRSHYGLEAGAPPEIRASAGRTPA